MSATVMERAPTGASEAPEIENPAVETVQWNPAAAYRAAKEAVKAQLRADQIRTTIENRPNLPAVTDMRTAVINAAGESVQLSAWGVVGWWEGEAIGHHYDMVRYGGEAAVAAFQAEPEPAAAA